MSSCEPLPACDLHQARLAAPFAVLGIRTEEQWLVALDYLSPGTPVLPPQNALAEEVCRQLRAYFADPRFAFDLPLHLRGTPYQRRVWHAICGIPPGSTSTYFDIARRLHSAPRAVGQACGANPIPIVVPCHRVLAKDGGLGGFMNSRDGLPLAIKRWLLNHESR